MALEAPRADTTDDEIFRALYPQLRRFAAVVAPIEEEPDDLLQDALVETLRRHRLADLASPQAYLRRTMVNLASNHRRRLAARRRALRVVGPSADSAPA